MTSDGTLLRRVVPALLASRVLMAVGILFAMWFGTATPGNGLGPAFNGLFNSWDGMAYLRIADHGYSTAADPRYIASVLEHGYSPQLNADDAFLPAYPLAVRVAGALLGGNPVLGGLLVSLICEALALYFVFRLVEQERDAAAATFAVWGLALAPFAFFLGAIYTESMFIAAAAAAFYYMRGGHFAAASLAAAMACATRITGAAVLIALAIEYLRQRGLRWKPDVMWLFLAPLPLLAFAVYMQVHVGDGLALLHANTIFFGHEFAAPWSGLEVTWKTFLSQASGTDRFAWFRELLFGMLGIAACAAAWLVPRFPRSMAAYCTVVILMAVSISFWRSVPRYELALFPIAILIADATSHDRVSRGILLGTSAMLFTLGASIYAQGWFA